MEGEIIDKDNKKEKMTYKIAAKYIKNINFNIPNARTFFYYQKKFQIIKLTLKSKANKLKKILLKLKLISLLNP